MMTQGWVVKGPAKRFSSTCDYADGTNIVICGIKFSSLSLSGNQEKTGRCRFDLAENSILPERIPLVILRLSEVTVKAK